MRWQLGMVKKKEGDCLKRNRIHVSLTSPFSSDSVFNLISAHHKLDTMDSYWTESKVTTKSVNSYLPTWFLFQEVLKVSHIPSISRWSVIPRAIGFGIITAISHSPITGVQAIWSTFCNTVLWCWLILCVNHRQNSSERCCCFVLGSNHIACTCIHTTADCRHLVGRFL